MDSYVSVQVYSGYLSPSILQVHSRYIFITLQVNSKYLSKYPLQVLSEYQYIFRSKVLSGYLTIYLLHNGYLSKRANGIYPYIKCLLKIDCSRLLYLSSSF